MNAHQITSNVVETEVIVAGKASLRNRKFDKLLSGLPGSVQNLARDIYARWRVAPWEPTLQFKPLADVGKRFYSIRIGRDYRAICRAFDDTWVWCWVGTHEAYNRIASKDVLSWPDPTLP